MSGWDDRWQRLRKEQDRERGRRNTWDEIFDDDKEYVQRTYRDDGYTEYYERKSSGINWTKSIVITAALAVILKCCGGCHGNDREDVYIRTSDNDVEKLLQSCSGKDMNAKILMTNDIDVYSPDFLDDRVDMFYKSSSNGQYGSQIDILYRK